MEAEAMSDCRCARCTGPLVTPEQYDMGLCATCLLTSSLSKLVGRAAEVAAAPYPFNGTPYKDKDAE